ncbi:MAG: hypothetical protein ABIP35_11635 [Ginsengibacter sp.]
MFLKRLIRNRDKRKRFSHIGAGLVILIHSYEKYESGHGSYLLFGVAGLIFLAIAFVHPTIEKRAPWVDGVFLIIEGLLSIIVALDYFHLGKKALPITFLCLSFFQFYMAFRKSKKRIAVHKLNQ